MKLLKSFLMATSVLALLSSASWADSIATRASRIANDNAATNNVFKALTDTGTTALPFKTLVNNDLIRITFNAECGVLGPAESWVSVTILVDGMEANPKNGTDFALCTATSSTAYTWTGAVRQSFMTVPSAGLHHVQVLINLLNGATNWWLGDSSIAVEAQ